MIRQNENENGKEKHWMKIIIVHLCGKAIWHEICKLIGVWTIIVCIQAFCNGEGGVSVYLMPNWIANGIPGVPFAVFILNFIT